MEEWESLALNNRHIPHGRLGKRGKAGHAAEFNPRNAMGTYKITISSGKKKTTNNAGGVLEIHGFDPTEQGLQASFQIEATPNVDGVMLLAGSRKMLQKLVQKAQQSARSKSESPDESISVTRGNNAEMMAEPANEEGSSGLAMTGLPEDDNTNEARDDRLIASFEKNSFRSPKFWARWKGRAEKEPGVFVEEENSGYLVFDKADCRTFSGTLSSTLLSWDNKAMKGQKIKSTARPAGFTWPESELSPDD